MIENVWFTIKFDIYIMLFFLKIFHFSICLTSNKLYWIEDQLADVSTRFYMSASWRWRVEPSATWLDNLLLLRHQVLARDECILCYT